MRKLLSLNEREYFTEKGEKVIPTREEIRNHYRMDEKMYAVVAEFPSTGWRIKTGRMVGFEKFNTREDAEREVENRINEEIDYYLSIMK